MVHVPTLVDRFFEIVSHHADIPALVSDDGVMSYRELNIRVAQIAHAIEAWFCEVLQRDVGSEDVIGISLDKSPDLYASILAILAVGASYVPLDPSLPPTIRTYILESCRCSLVLSESGVLPSMQEHIGCISPPLSCATTTISAPYSLPLGRATVTDRCYTIFTSGSTGRPKGVQIRHCNLLNLVAWAHTEFSLGPNRRVLQYGTINFDPSVLDIFSTLLSGATLCIPSRKQRLSESGLARFCARHRVDHAFLPPSLLAILNSKRFPTLKTVLTGGEMCSPSTLHDWQSGRRLYNLYGPTECTVLVSFQNMQVDTHPANIGQAIPGVRLYVLDERMCRTQRGELHVAGLCVSSGYIGDVASTGRQFVHCLDIDKDTLYKTGDIVEIDHCNNLRFIGRVDRQVKLRGYRIELEEIEGALMKIGFHQTAVKVAPGDVLVAYVAPPSGKGSVALRDELAQVLSDYKLPKFFVEMEQLPCKHSGKVDFDALPVMQYVRATRGTRSCQSVQQNQRKYGDFQALSLRPESISTITTHPMLLLTP